MTKVKVFSGACGFTSVVVVEKLEKLKVNVRIISACKDIRAMNQDLVELDCSKGVFVRILNSRIYQLADQYLKHTDCPVPCAIIKAIQIELDAMVPKDVYMKFQKS